MAKDLPGFATRGFKKLSNAAFENAIPRMLADIHFRRAVIAGLEQEYRIGERVVQHPESAARRRAAMRRMAGGVGDEENPQDTAGPHRTGGERLTVLRGWWCIAGYPSCH